MGNVMSDLNLYEWVENTSQSSKDSIKNCNADSDKGYFLEFDVQCPKKLHDLHSDLPFSPEKIKIEKIEKFVANLHDKKENVIHTRK